MKLILKLIVTLGLTFLPGVAASAQSEFKPLKLDGFLLKWGAPDLGTSAHVTFSFATAPQITEDARNCAHIEGLGLLADRAGLSVDEVKREAISAFRIWEEAVDITFEEVASHEDADIVIGAQSRPRGFAYTNVHYSLNAEASASSDSDIRALGSAGDAEREFDKDGELRVATLSSSAICLNPVHHWKIGFDGNLRSYDLKYTFAHEIGHAIGLDHYLEKPSIMHFKYREAFDGLQPSDVLGGRWLYGAR